MLYDENTITVSDMQKAVVLIFIFSYVLWLLYRSLQPLPLKSLFLRHNNLDLCILLLFLSFPLFPISVPEFFLLYSTR